jgi:hypothetical protein
MKHNMNELSLSDLVPEREKEPEYFERNPYTVVKTHYPDLMDSARILGIELEFDWEDWINQKTHFKYDGHAKQWESYTLELLSEGEG